MAKLAMDPSTRGYLSQPDFMQMLQLLQKNPGMMSNFMQDQRFSHALSVSSQLLVHKQEGALYNHLDDFPIPSFQHCAQCVQRPVVICTLSRYEALPRLDQSRTGCC